MHLGGGFLVEDGFRQNGEIRHLLPSQRAEFLVTKGKAVVGITGFTLFYGSMTVEGFLKHPFSFKAPADVMPNSIGMTAKATQRDLKP
jgi:hypothetical protein